MKLKMILPILLLVLVSKNTFSNPGRVRDALSAIVHGDGRHYRYYNEPVYVEYPDEYYGSEEALIERKAALEKRDVELRKQEELARTRRKELEREKRMLK